MAVAFDATSETGSSNASGPVDLTTLTVGSGSNRALIALVDWRNSKPTSPTITWDPAGANQALTLITGATANNGSIVELYGLIAPVSGNKTLRANWTGATNTGISLCGLSVTGVDQTGGATSFPHGNGATGTSTAPAVTITTATANGVCAIHSNSSGATYSAVDHTQLFIDNTNQGDAAAGNYQITSGATSVTLGATQGKSKAWQSAGTDMLAAANVFGGAFSEPEYIRSSLIAVGYH